MSRFQKQLKLSERKSSTFHFLLTLLLVGVIVFVTLIFFGRYIFLNEHTSYEDRYFIKEQVHIIR